MRIRVNHPVIFLFGHIHLPDEIRQKVNEIGQWHYVWNVIAQTNLYGVSVATIQRGDEIMIVDTEWITDAEFAQGTAQFLGNWHEPSTN